MVHILSFHSYGVVSFFIFPTGQIALDSEPRGRRYAKNTGHDRNHLYQRAIHCPASMEMHYVQWFLLKSVYEITVCEKKLDFTFLILGGPSHDARVWCLSRVPKHRNQWQEVEGLLFSPQKLSVGANFELLFLGCGFLIHLSNRSDSPRFRAPWKEIRQKYGTQQEPSLFKGHPLSCQYGDALCSMVPT